MGRTSKSEREKMVASMVAYTGKMFLSGRWEWRGARFVREACYHINELRFYVNFVVSFQTIEATVNAGELYGMKSESKKFSGDEAIGECAQWTAEKLADLYETVSPRLAPYAEAHNRYERALLGLEGNE